MDKVFVGTDFHSTIVLLLARTRVPFVQIETDTRKCSAPVPHIVTDGGIVLGLPAIIDYLLHRVTEPPLIFNDIRRRGMQMTVFWALIEREFPKLIEPTADEVRHWLDDVKDQLHGRNFYVSDTFSICDIALYALLVRIAVMVPLPQAHKHYMVTCSNAIDGIQKSNAISVEDHE